MFSDVSIIGVFAEDVREEKGGAETLVGIFTDNVLVPGIPGQFAKLVIYVRAHFPVTLTPAPIDILLRVPGTADIQLSTFDEALIAKTLRESKEQGSPIVALISRATAAPFPIIAAGRYLVICRSEGIERVAITMNVITSASAVSTNETPPPSSQSAPAASSTS